MSSAADRGTDGLAAQAPEVLNNRPGRSAVAYRVGTHSRFKATMLARLSAADLPALHALRTRSDRDFGIALLDAWATVADVLTFYQERIANESYLRTATERRSLVELSGLIGYQPRPGVAASAYLAFTLDAAPGTEVPVPAGTAVQSMPGPGQIPQTFETVERITGRPEWNALEPLKVRRHPDISPQAARITVRGTATGVSPGDSLLLVSGAGTAQQTVKRVHDVLVDHEAQVTRIDLQEDPPDPPPFRMPLLRPAGWDPTPVKLTSLAVTTKVLSGVWRHADLAAFAKVHSWSPLQLSTSISVQIAALRKFRPVGTGVFAFRHQAAIFGHNAPKYSTLPASMRLTDYVTGSSGSLVPVNPPYPTSWEGRRLSDEPGAPRSEIDLDNTYPGIVTNSWLVLEDQFRRTVYRVTDTAELSRADFTLTGKVSRIRLDSATDFHQYSLRTTTVRAGSVQLELAELPITDVVKGNRLLLDGVHLGLAVGRVVIVTGTRTDLDGVTDSEVTTIADVSFSGGVTELVFVDSLAHEYARNTVRVNANVARATHGETRRAVLGGGDANKPYPRLPLPESPLTYVSAPTPSGASSTVEVRVNGVRWDEVETMHGRGPEERVFRVRTTDDGHSSVQFGDGLNGARVPTGTENVHATYRKGMGAEGLVDANRLTLLLSRPLGVREVTNPLPAGDAASAEGPDELRRNAALPTRALARIVALRDYEDFARAFAGVAKALATWTWNGRNRGIFVTVAGHGGAAVNPDGVMYKNLLAAMLAAGDGAVPVRVKSYLPAFFRLAAKVGIDPAHQSEKVLAAVEAALRLAFGFDAREFGRPVAKSEVITVIQAVPGVVAVDLDELSRVDAPIPGAADRLVARVPRAGTDVTVAAELLLLDPRPVPLGVMAR